MNVRVWLVLCLAMMAAGSAAAQDIESLRAQNRLTVSSELEPATDIVVGQQVKLYIQIATDRWFSGGTRIRLPEVPGLVILQTESFAANGSERRGGDTWVTQRWSIEVYPQRPGRFDIPGLSLELSVADGSGGAITGTTTSPALSFSAVVPAALDGVAHWVAAPRYTVSEQQSGSPEALGVGDAFTRDIRLEADDVMAMMLPAIEVDAVSGLGIYPDPPQLDNRSNRGTMRASRVQRITYIAESPGQYRLPAMDFYWWDTNSTALQLRSLPAVDLVVAGTLPDNTSVDDPTVTIDWRRLAMGGGIVIALAVLSHICLAMLRSIPWMALRRRAHKAARAWRRWRRPGLPPSLNPDSSFVD